MFVDLSELTTHIMWIAIASVDPTPPVDLGSIGELHLGELHFNVCKADPAKDTFTWRRSWAEPIEFTRGDIYDWLDGVKKRASA